MLELTPEIGQHIDKACAAACARAHAEELPVKFRFNGTDVIAWPGETLDVVSHRWDESREAEAIAYRASPEYMVLQAERQKKVALAQTQLDHLVSCLPSAIRHGEREIVRWCRDFVPLNDWTYVSCDRAAVAAQLLAAGYQAGDCVEHPQVQTDPSIMARWIVGQVLEGLMNQEGIVHPIMASFADEFLKAGENQ